MKVFMDRDFLLETETAKHLYHDYAEKAPLVDYHCHISPRDIYENRRFENLAQLWLGGRQADGTLAGDHYKWRLMRANAVNESYITGDKPDYQRFLKFVQALELAIGNPVYHWCHMELKQFFDYDKPLTPDNAGEVWDYCNDKLRSDPGMTARSLMEKANVIYVGTTDDPIDCLEWHRKIAADPSFSIHVAPSFRPDRAVAIHKPDFLPYMTRLAASVGKESLNSFREVCDALVERLEYFKEQGCGISDHGLDYVPYRACTTEEADSIYRKVCRGSAVTAEEAEKYQTAILLHLGRAYHRLGIAMQIHYSCLRNPNRRMFAQLGPDSGYDAISQNTCGSSVAALLSELDSTCQCPRTILYSLNPADNALLDTLIGSFQGEEVAGKIQHGSAWWFNDNKMGMTDQLTSLANQGLLGNFVGMLTDSRSFLSYARHHYFRRILCNLIGSWVEKGECPNHEPSLQKIVEGICSKNALRYFNL